MKKILLFTALFLAGQLFGQTPRETFEQRIDSILATTTAHVGFALCTPSGELVTRNDTPLPMMSLFKFPLAIAVLDGMNYTQGDLSYPIPIGKEWLSPGTYSPMRDSLPADGGKVSIQHL